MLHRQIDQYRLVRVLGEGGMGVVYEGVRDDIGARAAVKVLRPEFARNADVAARFFNEARAANLIDHPGIVRIFDYGQLSSGEGYLAMEFLEGEVLRTRLERERRLSEPEAMKIARQIASALSAAHSKQIIHRDLKPENVMLVADAETPGGERAKILDFGIAKLSASVSAHRTRTNTVMGTPAYMAPEQCRGIKTIDDRVDVYALGVMLFEMVSGRPPFVAEAPGDLAAMHMFQTPPTLEEVLPGTDRSLNRLLTAMLAKDPASRPSMATVVQTLKTLGLMTSDAASGQVPVVRDQALMNASSVPMPEAAYMPKSGGYVAAAPPTAQTEMRAVDLEETVKTSGSQKASPRPMPPPELPAAKPLAVGGKALKPSSLVPARPRDRAPAFAVPPSPRGDRLDDSTELLADPKMIAKPSPASRLPQTEEGETVPFVRGDEANLQRPAYVRKRDRPQPARAQGAAESALAQKDASSSHDPMRPEAGKRLPTSGWSIPTQKKGLIVFIGMSVFATFLAVMILSHC